MFIENLRETISLGENLRKNYIKFNCPIERSYRSGKTSFVQGIAKGLSITDDITSPTFALSHHYSSGKIPLIHLDLYRLEDVSMAREFFVSEEEEADENKAILIIEWPELIQPIIKNFWKIEISYARDYGRNYKIWDPKNSLTFL